jgi:hypothetical protein
MFVHLCHEGPISSSQQPRAGARRRIRSNRLVERDAVGGGLGAVKTSYHTPMTLKVIGAGFGRTGTTSLKAALEQLGFSKCHHMQEVVKSSRQLDYWQTLAEGGDVAWDEVFEGYQSSCDWPSCTYWEELSREYPEAKIILSLRDPERWHASGMETIYPATYLVPRWIGRWIPRLGRFNKMTKDSVWEGVFGGRFPDRDHAMKIYLDHNEYVKATAPKDRLLVFEAKDGWGPLCEFLEVPVPDGDYPHLNDASQIRSAILGARIFGWVVLVALGAGILSLLV